MLPPQHLAADVELLLDDGTSEGDSGFNGATAFQFLWLNRFAAPAEDFLLEAIEVLFGPGSNMSVGAAVELVVYEDDDGDPANGATLLASLAETIQVLDGTTFSVYPIDPPIEVSGGGDVLIGVVDRFVVSGTTSPTFPAAIDTTASQGRSWFATWSGDPPSGAGEPALPSDNAMSVVSGNWMIRAFGSFPPPPIPVPTLGEWGLLLLTLLLAAAGAVRLRRRLRPSELGP